MTSLVVLGKARQLPGFFCKFVASAAAGLALCASIAHAKQPTLTAIELYDASSGAAYLQIGDVLINAKAEMRDCTPFQSAPIDKSIYGKMGKVPLTTGGVLDRDKNGVLHYTTGSRSICVVPDNVKFDHGGAYSLSELADHGPLTGSPIAPPPDAPTAVPPLAKGVKLVFVAAPDQEFAEYLRADRASDIAAWLKYNSQYSASPNIAKAKLSLGLLYLAAADTSLNAFQKSAATDAPAYTALKDAKDDLDKAKATNADLPQIPELVARLHADLTDITTHGRKELDAYQVAFKSHAAGYVHLENATKLSNAVTMVDPQFAPGQSLSGDVTIAVSSLESALHSAESAVVAKQMDQAMDFIANWRPFTPEVPRLSAVVDAADAYYLQLGKHYGDAGDWENAIKQYEKADKAKDTQEAQDDLKEAHRQLAIAQDKAVAAKAQEVSKNYEQQNDILDAFETLYNLTPSQQALVADDITRLKDQYVQAAVKAEKDIQKAHPTIIGLGDERDIEKAYNYLGRAFTLSSVDSYKDTMDILGEDLSNYYVTKAKTYLDKPAGSGTEMGWVYLQRALQYKRSNQAAHDEMVAAAPAHAMHSKISVRVQFRDQTSQRDSSGFSHQLEDAIITGLEAPTLTSIRFGETTGGADPDFQLAGDVLEHQISQAFSSEPKESHYRAGTREEPSPEWVKANRALEAATRQLTTDQSELNGAAAKGKKHDVKQMTSKIAADNKAIADAQTLADSLPKTVTVDVARPYQYTRKTTTINNTIKLQFRIGDSLSARMGEPISVEKDNPKQYLNLEDVKSDDIDNVKREESAPNMRELQIALENDARNELVQKVLLKVRELPHQLYLAGKSREVEENDDGAGEYYLRFLSCTSEDGSAEREHARAFLADKFNMHPAASAAID
jgi:hypothetical protein